MEIPGLSLDSLYYNAYVRLRRPLIELMLDGVAWDFESAEKEREGLVKRKEELKGELDARTGVRLYALYRHRSDRRNELLSEQRRLRASKVDTKERSPERKAVNDAIEEVQAKLRELRESGGDVDITRGDGLSDDRVGEFLYGDPVAGGLGLPSHKRRRKGSGKSTVTVDNRALLKIKGCYEWTAGIVDLILEHRRCEKLISTYLNPMKMMSQVDGRFHSQYKIHGTQTGRLSSGSDPWDQGGNAQNQDREFKWLFLPTLPR